MLFQFFKCPEKQLEMIIPGLQWNKHCRSDNTTVIHSGKGGTGKHTWLAVMVLLNSSLLHGPTHKCLQTHNFLPVHAFNAVKSCNSCHQRICCMVSAIIHGSLKLYFLIKQHPKLNREHPGTRFRSCARSFSKLELTFYFPLWIFMSRHNKFHCPVTGFTKSLPSSEMLGAGLMFQYRSSPVWLHFKSKSSFKSLLNETVTCSVEKREGPNCISRNLEHFSVSTVLQTHVVMCFTQKPACHLFVLGCNVSK